MRKFIKRYIRQNCGECAIEQDAHGNVLVTKGVAETYPCLASHIDQVQSRHSKDFCCVTNGDVVFGYSPKCHEQQGLGADDKNGIYICLECLKKYDIIKCAFFVGEETGCVGSSVVDVQFFKDCRFIIEPDRRGSSDLITSMFCGDVCSQEFIDAIDAKSFGYSEEHGSITDVGVLIERGVGISCLNLSCGYYEAHSDHEFTVLSELQHCLEFVESIIERATSVYPYEYSYIPRNTGYVRLGGGKNHEASSYRLDSGKTWYNGLYDWGHDWGHDWDHSDTASDFYYYDGGFYDEDLEVMIGLIEADPNISFDVVLANYNFYASDEDTLRDVYDDAKTMMEDNSINKAS